MNSTRRNFIPAAAFLAPAQPRARQLIIDAHSLAGNGLRSPGHPFTFEDPETILRQMEEAGIQRTVICPLENQDYAKANEEIAGICRRYPGKFIGFARHNPATDPERIPELLTREVRELGLKGLKITRLPSRGLLETVSQLGIPVIYQAERMVNLNMIAREFPKTPFIVAHLGSFNYVWGEHLAAIDLARRYSNVYLDTSMVGLFQFMEMAAKEVGASKLIFGSGGPEFDARVEVYKIKLLKFSAADEAKVLGGNIQRLLPKGSISS
jgi:predicted TIM-barrel fold metal-dependent hydrolase